MHSVNEMMLPYFLMFFPMVFGNEWIFYSSNVESGDHDCLFYDSRWFCRRPEGGLIQRDSICYGQTWSMKSLREQMITTEILFDWFLPYDEVERYARFLQLTSKDAASMEHETICNCSSKNFGSNCIYQRPNQTTIGILINRQIVPPPERTMAMITCFVDGIQCRSGFVCLEWRQICDGVVQCDSGVDEMNCFLLEFHQCESNEYQCRNGMCIPEEFAFDSIIDCMDRSDEQETSEDTLTYESCAEKWKFHCDELLCRKNEFSCGDGQCIDWTNLITYEKSCESLRNRYGRCETLNNLTKFYTVENGICNYKQYYPSVPSCSDFLRYLLVGNNRKKNFESMRDNCPMLIHFPNDSIITSNLNMYYNTSLIKEFYASKDYSRQYPSVPHLICLTGSSICNGMNVTLNEDYCFNYTTFETWTKFPFLPISHLLCNLTFSIPLNVTIENVQSFNRSNIEVPFYQCRHSDDIISLRHTNDGYIDCLLGDDEMNIDHLPKNKAFRYRCSSVNPVQYVSVQLLGNQVKDCLDGSDERSWNIDWNYFDCDYESDYACWIFRNSKYIDEVRLLFHRHCDSVWDLMDGQDERNCSSWICPRNKYQCNRTGQCIDRSRKCDTIFDCSDGEDELGCYQHTSSPKWILKAQCNHTSEHFCITADYLLDQKSSQPCIDWSKAGDEKPDCIGGLDERNTFSCSDHEMLDDRFLCDNQSRCISPSSVCNGIIDCVDVSDENLCLWNWNASQTCPAGGLICRNKTCSGAPCHHSNTRCSSDNETLFWCPTAKNAFHENTRQRLVRGLSNYNTFCNLPEIVANSTNQVKPNTTRGDLIKATIYLGYCNRGFHLLIQYGSAPRCFCPPSFYGDRCEFDRRRITLRIRVDRFHSQDIPPALHLAISLIHNNDTVFDRITIVDVLQEFPQKNDLHLLYPRPKPTSGFFSVQIEAYADIKLLHVWQYPISPLDFLPAYRLAKILRLPLNYPHYCPNNFCQNNGTCHLFGSSQEQRYMCLCQQKWTGQHCEQNASSQCAPGSARHPNGFCVCPQGYLLPHCFVRNSVCETKSLCPFSQTCVPHSTRFGQYSCFCLPPNCTKDHPLIVFTSEQVTLNQSLLIQLLKYSSNYPRLRQQFLLASSSPLPIIKNIEKRDRRRANGSIPEIGLLHRFNRTFTGVSVTTNLLFINCSDDIRNLTINLDEDFRACHSIPEPLPLVQQLHTFCKRQDYYPCFYTPSYMCYCSSITNGSECMSYQQQQMTCSYCLNQGFCVQGDLQNLTDFQCICPLCVTGDLCQFPLNRFSVSFEWLLEKTGWGQMHFVIPIIFFSLGFVFNSLTIATLTSKGLKSTGVSDLLLLNSIISQLLLSFILIRVVYLQMLRRASTINVVNVFLCKTLPYLTSSLSYYSSWLMALVTVARALVICFPLQYEFLRGRRAANILSVFIGIALFSSVSPQIQQYKLVSHPNSNLWCVTEIPLNQRRLFQILSVSHQLIPFLINISSALIIIIGTGISKATSRHQSQRWALAEQIRKHFDLLLGPMICFLSQIPQLSVLFFNPCTYDENRWFSSMTLIASYVSFIPQISSLLLYILPSALYKNFLRRRFCASKRRK